MINKIISIKNKYDFIYIMTRPKPRDMKLYEKVKKEIYKKYIKHSAYRSGHLVREYKKQYAEKYGEKSDPYIGNKTKKRGLKRWFDEKWVNQRGKVGYKYDNDIYRPSIRITDETPVTHGELSKKEIERARNEKYRKGRVHRFKKTQKRVKTGGKKKNMLKLDGVYSFHDYPDFQPNLSPKEMFELGSFGGTYWRPIKSKFYPKVLKNQHKKYPDDWWENVPEKWLTTPFDKYDKKINKYGKKVGTTLQFWEKKGWIDKQDPYGWVQWYCEFFMGRRSEDDKRQVDRWKALAGPKGRFRKWLVTQIVKSEKEDGWKNEKVSPAIRQTLQHWGYVLTKKDYDNEIKTRNKNI